MQTKAQEYQELTNFINKLDKNSYLFNWLNSEKEFFKSAMESDFFYADSIKSTIERKNELDIVLKAQDKKLQELIFKEKELTQKIDHSMQRAATLKNHLNNCKDNFDCLMYEMNRMQT